MKIRIKYTILLLLINIKIIAQSQVKEQLNLNQYIAFNEDFTGAIRLYKQMILFDPNNPEFTYKLGYAYLNTFGKQDSAIIMFKKTLKLLSPKLQNTINIKEVKFYLARAYRLNGELDSSAILLETLLKEISDLQTKKIIIRELQLAQYSLNQYFTIKNLGNIINSGYTEHSPVFSPKYKILVYTSRRKAQNSTIQDDGQFDENIYMSIIDSNKWTTPIYISELNTEGNDATVGFCNNGKTLILYRGINKGDLYLSNYQNGQWTQPQPLPYPINTRHRETHATFSANMDTIYFTSDRPGSKGGLDIWMSYKDKNGNWTKPLNIKELNTKYNEECPVLLPQKNILFFSSDRKGGLGGYDIYKTKLINNHWQKIQNIGFPINSIDHDVFFYPIPQIGRAFYTSYKYDSKGFGDVYLINLDSVYKPKQITNIGSVYDSTGHAYDNVKIEILNLDQGKKTTIVPHQGHFKFKTLPNITYQISVYKNNELYFRENYKLPNNAPDELFYKRIIIK